MIHPTAHIDPRVEIEKGVSIGAYVHITGHVKIGKNTVISSHVNISGPVAIGEDNFISSFVVIGSGAQHLKNFHIEEPLLIGDKNIFSPHVTVNQGIQGHRNTSIGHGNFLGDFVHIAHNCFIGSHVTLLYGSVLAGHVVMQDHSYMGYMSTGSQFTTVGEGAYLDNMTAFDRDIPPFVKCGGGRTPPIKGIAETYLFQELKLNKKDVLALKEAYSSILGKDMTIRVALAEIDTHHNAFVHKLVSFIKNSKKGIPRFFEKI